LATHLAPAPVNTRSTRGARAWAWATLALFVVVVLEGAVVRATSSGGGCGSHWPLCNGELLPHHPRLATIIEFTHRSLTGISTTMFAVLIAWTYRVTPKRHPARLASVVAGILLLIEGALGAVLVLGGYVEKNASVARVFVQGIHFTNTMLLLAAATVVAVLLGRPRTALSQINMGRPMLLALLASILTGATGSVAALADTLFPSPSLGAAIAADFAAASPLLIRMRWIHPASAVFVIACTLVLIVGFSRRGYSTLAIGLASNLVAQIVVGLVDVLLLAPTTIQVLHLFSADVFWISLVAIAVPMLLPQAASEAAALNS
jgi:cytochrome c oxidase assembly protein subunit 15